MTISISKASREDVVDIVNVRAAAFANDPRHQYGMPSPMTDEQKQDYRQYQLDAIRIRLDLSSRHYFKAIDEPSGQMVGFSCWNSPEEKDGYANDDEPPPPPMPELPSFVDKATFDEVGEKFKQTRARIMGERADYWFLQAMCVRPECQGRGIGDQLLKQGLRDLVDKDGVDCYLESSEAAHRLYAKNGFSPEESVPLVNGTFIVRAMLRKAPAGGG